MAPIHPVGQGTPMRICVLVRTRDDPAHGPFVLLREIPGARIYLGCLADVEGRLLDWLEVWTQAVDLQDFTFSGQQELAANRVFDERWQRDGQLTSASHPEAVILTGMETEAPAPVVIERSAEPGGSAFAVAEPSRWRVCTNDAKLQSLGLPAYSSSPFRYLGDSQSSDSKTLISTMADAPTNEHVEGLDQIAGAGKVVFNPQGGRVRINRWTTLSWEEHLGILEGNAWEPQSGGLAPVLRGSIYAKLQSWSTTPKGLPFLLHGEGRVAERFNEILLLKLSLLRDLFREAKAYVQSHQLPLLNLAPNSFAVQLEPVGETFPALWSAHAMLVKPGQAFPMGIKATDQRYFVRLGKTEPSPFLPEGLGVRASGSGSVRIRDVQTEAGGVVVDGTLVAEDYLKVEQQDLLWFRLPLGEDRVELFAHAQRTENAGPKEVRFRTLPARLPERLLAALKQTAGTAFPRSLFQVWPLLSSPCDLYSLGVMAVRTLLANSTTNLPVLLDEVLSVARRLGEQSVEEDQLGVALAEMAGNDERLNDLLSPHALSGLELNPEQARAMVAPGLWLDAMCLLLRLFPGTGQHSYCKSLGDVSPLALETAFGRPLQELESLVLRQRSLMVPSLMANQEIADVLLGEMAEG